MNGLAFLMLLIGAVLLFFAWLGAGDDEKGNPSRFREAVSVTRTYGVIFLCAAVAVFVLGQLRPTPASAQVLNCSGWSEMQWFLSGRFGETPVAAAQIGPTLIMQVLVSASGTFTIVHIDPRGVACIIAAGTDWELLPQPPIGETEG